MFIIDDFEVPFIPMQKNYSEWHSFDSRWENDNFAALVSGVAQVLYRTQDAVGYEIWQRESHTDLHIDKDEELYRRRQILTYPICSIVFYYDVQDLKGGELYSDSWEITPKKNRLVVFGPNVTHGVRPFTGIRKSVLVNPWAHELGHIPQFF